MRRLEGVWDDKLCKLSVTEPAREPDSEDPSLLGSVFLLCPKLPLRRCFCFEESTLVDLIVNLLPLRDGNREDKSPPDTDDEEDMEEFDDIRTFK